jgi:uncharacterized RDD family membrane protein YckC
MVQYAGSWVCATCKPAFFQRVRQGEAVGPGLKYGNFWPRFAAKFIDGIAMQIVILPVQMALGAFTIDPTQRPTERLGASLVSMFVGICIAVTYTTFFLGRFGATPGKMALGMKVVAPDGSPIGYGKALGRYFAELLNGFTFGIGYIIAANDPERRALHDRIVGTRVIRS